MAESPIPDIDALPQSAMLTTEQVATLSGYSIQSLKIWRGKGRGPRVTIIEGRPRYRCADVRAWMGVGHRGVA